MNTRHALGLVAGILLVLSGAFLLVYDSEGITITWETASEVDTRGFNLYRSAASAEGPYVQVNANMIPAEGDPLTGATYRIRDRDVTAGVLYFYQIEEIEGGGTRNRHPEVVQARAGVRHAWLVGEGLLLMLLGCGLIYLQVLQRRSFRIGSNGPQGNRIQGEGAG